MSKSGRADRWLSRRARAIGFVNLGGGYHGFGVDMAVPIGNWLNILMGTACAIYQDQAFVNLPCKRIQVDEIWSFVGSKEKNVPEGKEGPYGDVWTWTAICAAGVQSGLTWIETVTPRR